MPTTLQEMQFELLPSLDADTGLAFGDGLEVFVEDDGFDPGALAWTTQDQANPINGTMMFGRDVPVPPTWAWTLHLNREDAATALDTLGRLKSAWMARRVVEDPRSNTCVRYCMGGRTRRVYGRPGNFSSPLNNLLLVGRGSITADFRATDPYTYDDVESSAVLQAAATLAVTGFVFPTVFPASSITATGGNPGQGAVVIGGDSPTYPVVKFTGPLTRPWLITNNWRLDLDTIIPSGMSVTVDTRPWGLTAVRSDGLLVDGAISPGQWMPDMFFEPGDDQLTFDADVVQGGSSCTVSWRNAWSSI